MDHLPNEVLDNLLNSLGNDFSNDLLRVREEITKAFGCPVTIVGL